MDCHNRNNTTSTATNTNDGDDTTTCCALAVDSAYSWSMNTHVPESSRGHCDHDRTVSNDLLPSQNLHSTLLDRVKYSLGHGWNLVRNGLRLHARSIHTFSCITQGTAASRSSVNDRRDKTTSSSSSFVECRVVSFFVDRYCRAGRSCVCHVEVIGNEQLYFRRATPILPKSQWQAILSRRRTVGMYTYT